MIVDILKGFHLFTYEIQKALFPLGEILWS